MFAPLVLGYSTYPARTEHGTLQFPVVLVRGLGRSSGFWLEFIDALTPWAKVITVDLFGTGKSPSHWGRGTISGLAADLEETLVAEGILPCHLVGISLGGMVCAETAARLATRASVSNDHGSSCAAERDLASLSVMASSARFTQQRRIAPAALLPFLYSLRKAAPRNREFARYLVSPEALLARPDLPEIWDEIWRQEGFHKLAVVRQLLAASLFDGGDTLDAIRQPTCYIVSRDDALVSWRNSQRLWERTNGSRLVVMDGPGHDFPTERPLETAAALIDFFRTAECRGYGEKGERTTSFTATPRDPHQSP